jgi:hypothetical protein
MYRFRYTAYIYAGRDLNKGLDKSVEDAMDVMVAQCCHHLQMHALLQYSLIYFDMQYNRGGAPGSENVDVHGHEEYATYYKTRRIEGFPPLQTT